MLKKVLFLIVVTGIFVSPHSQVIFPCGSKKIVVRDTVSIDTLQMRSDQDTLLQVVCKDQVDGRWVPVVGNWIYHATKGDTTVLEMSWRFKPGDTGTGVIVVEGPVPDTILVKILPGLPKSVALYGSELPPGPAVVKLGDPGQVIPIAAGTRNTLVAKVLDWKGVWLSQYQTSAGLQTLFSWSASDRAGSLNSTLDGFTGAVTHITPTRAWDTVTVVNTLRIDASNVFMDTVRFAVTPGPAARLVIEPKGPIHFNTPSVLDTLRILSNETQRSVYSTLRDAYGNFVRYANVAAWGSLNTQVVTVGAGNGTFGEGVVTRFPAATDSITLIVAMDAIVTSLKDSCYVKLGKYYYARLRIVIGNDTNPVNLAMNTNQDTMVKVQGLRSMDAVWEDMPATWQTSTNLKIDPATPVGPYWWFSPSDTGTGWIRVTLNNDGVTIPDTVPVRFTPGPPVRASFEIITQPDSIIAGKPIVADVRIYDKDGHSYTYTFDTTAGKAVTYHDALGTGGLNFPEPFVIVDGKNLCLNPSSTDRGNQTFIYGRDTVSLTLFYAPFDTTQKHRITGNLIIGSYTISASSAPFVLHPGQLAHIMMVYPDGTKVPDTLRLTNPVSLVSRGYDQYGNLIGDIIGNWSVTDSLHQITGPVTGSSIFYDPRAGNTCESGSIIVSNNGMKDSVYLACAGLPEQVILISPIDSAKIPVANVLFAWKKTNPLVTRYQLQVATDSAMNFSIQDSTITDTTKLIQSLSNGQTYYWRVRACNASGWGPYSQKSRFTVGFLAVPGVVVPVTPKDSAAIPSDNVIVVWFKAEPLVTKYCLQIATDSAMNFSIQDSTITDTTKLFNSLSYGQSYWWRVRAYNTIGWGPYSQKSRFTCVRNAVLPKEFEINSFTCRGSSKILHYTLPRQCFVSLKYYDISGRQVGSFVNQTQGPGYYALSLPFSAWSRGAYVQVFRAGSFVKKERVVVTR